MLSDPNFKLIQLDSNKPLTIFTLRNGTTIYTARNSFVVVIAHIVSMVGLTLHRSIFAFALKSTKVDSVEFFSSSSLVES